MRRFQLKFGSAEDCSTCCSVLSTFFPCRVVVAQSPAQLVLSQQRLPLSQDAQYAFATSPPNLVNALASSTPPFIVSSQNNKATNEVAFLPHTQQYRCSPIMKFGMSPAAHTPLSNDLLQFTARCGRDAGRSDVLGGIGASTSMSSKSKRKADDVLCNDITDSLVGATPGSIASTFLSTMSDEALRRKVIDKLADPNFLQFVAKLERVLNS